VVKLFVKLAIVALLANAVFRVGSEYVNYIKFRDAIRDAAMFKSADDDDLHRRIMALSTDYDIPLADDAFTIQRAERHVMIEGKYEKKIEVAPSFRYPWPFTWSIDAITSTTVPLIPPKR
jgi:hypothetical protein